MEFTRVFFQQRREGSRDSCLRDSYFRRKDVDLPQPTQPTKQQSAGECFLRGPSEVIVMQPVHNSDLVNLPVGLDLSRFRCVFVDPEVCPLGVGVADVTLKYRSQMTLIHDDQIVQAFSPDAAHQSLAISILPR